MTIDECLAMYPGCVVEGDVITLPSGVYMKFPSGYDQRIHVGALDTICPIVRVSDEEWVREWVRRTPGAEVTSDSFGVAVYLPGGYFPNVVSCEDWSKVREALGGVALTLPYKPMEG